MQSEQLSLQMGACFSRIAFPPWIERANGRDPHFFGVTVFDACHFCYVFEVPWLCIRGVDIPGTIEEPRQDTLRRGRAKRSLKVRVLPAKASVHRQQVVTLGKESTW